MRIFIQPRNGDSFATVIAQAIKILQASEIASTHVNRDAGDFRPAVMIDSSDLPEVLEILERAGMRLTVN